MRPSNAQQEVPVELYPSMEFLSHESLRPFSNAGNEKQIYQYNTDNSLTLSSMTSKQKPTGFLCADKTLTAHKPQKVFGAGSAAGKPACTILREHKLHSL